MVVYDHTMTTFQYVSDLHLEYYNENMNKIRKLFIEPLVKSKGDAKYLLLAGDVGRPTNMSYQTFLQELSSHYERIFVTTGNHEYYKMQCGTIADLDEVCRDACARAGNNVVFLQNERYDIDQDLCIFGGTFWTDIPPQKRGIVSDCINDYRLIQNFTPAASTAMHKHAVASLSSELKSHPEKKWIVMSHHMPSFSLIDEKYKKGNMTDINYAFASDVVIAKDDRIKAWVYGHTHTPSRCGKFFCNPIGYPGERREGDWREWCAATFTVEVDGQITQRN